MPVTEFKKFIDYYRGKEVILTESPMRMGRHYGDDLEDTGFNFHESQRIVDELPAIATEKILNHYLTLYRDSYDNDKFMDYWITQQPFITCYFMFQKQDTGLQSLGVWNEIRYQGTARNLLFNHYLQKYNFIISDNRHTEQGEKYWKRIIEDGTRQGYSINVLTRSGNEVDIDSTDDYWGQGPEFSEYRIKIYAK
jgi:hypothetical protein